MGQGDGCGVSAVPSDPTYKIRHVVTPVGRLTHYEYLPPPMKGDPQPTMSEFEGVEGWQSWEERERAVYDAMMKEKRAKRKE